MGNDFFYEIKSWTRWKHTLLEKLITTKAYASMKSFTYIDGLAGAGSYYGDGGKGSPLIALDVLNDVALKKDIHIDAVFIEKKNENYKKLYEQLQNYQLSSDNLNVHFKNGNFHHNIESCLEFTPRYGLVFVDPFGVKGYDDTSIARIRNFSKDIDVVINFPINAVRRTVGLGKNNMSARATIEKLLGVEYNIHPQIVINNYFSKLKGRFDGVGYCILNNTMGGELFYLTLCTNDVNLFSSYNDFLFKISNRILFDRKEWVYKNIKKKPISQKNLMFALLNNDIGGSPSKQYTEHLRTLMSEKKIGRRDNNITSALTFKTKGLRTRISKPIFIERILDDDS